MELYGGTVKEQDVTAVNKEQRICIPAELVETRKMQLESHMMILEIIRKLYGDDIKPEEAPEYNNIAGMAATNRLVADWNMRLLKSLDERLSP